MVGIDNIDTLGGWYGIDTSRLGRFEVANIKRECTFTPKITYGGESPDPIQLYKMRGSRLLVPTSYGLNKFPNENIREELSKGRRIEVPKFPNPNHPSVENPAMQQAFMDDMLRCALDNYAFCAEAPTGSGKTVVGLNTAGKLGRTTLVLVHLERLCTQWVKEIQQHLGIPLDRISIIRGDKMDFQGKDFCVGLYQSISKEGKYPPDFYDYFGTVIFDEVHKTGARLLSQCLPLFNANVRIGLSATMERSDGCEKIYQMHLGAVQCKSEAEAMEMICYPINYKSSVKYPTKGNISHMILHKIASRDKQRNKLLVNIISKLYHNNRNILVTSHLLDHLKHLQSLLVKANIPIEDTGLFISSNAANLDDIAKNSKIILATNGMITEGVDIPRLDAGVDATPSGKAKQLIGRTRRPLKGKKTPVWYTIVDLDVPRYRKYFKKRLKDYKESNVRIKYNDNKIYR